MQTTSFWYVVLVLALSCTSPDRAASTLEAQGFTNVEITGFEMLSCSSGDGTCTGFDATAPGGHRVHGAVGCGRMAGCGKGCTVRIEP